MRFASSEFSRSSASCSVCTTASTFLHAFSGAIKAGVVPVPINTMWSAADYAYVLQDSRAKAVVVSEARLPVMEEAARISGWKGTMIVAGDSHPAHPRLACADGVCIVELRSVRDAARRRVLLALLFRLDRKAKGRGARADQLDADG